MQIISVNTKVYLVAVGIANISRSADAPKKRGGNVITVAG